MTEKETTRISKFLSLILRHEPERVGLRLDEAGWVGVDALLSISPFCQWRLAGEPSAASIY